MTPRRAGPTDSDPPITVDVRLAAGRRRRVARRARGRPGVVRCAAAGAAPLRGPAARGRRPLAWSVALVRGVGRRRLPRWSVRCSPWRSSRRRRCSARAPARRPRATEGLLPVLARDGAVGRVEGVVVGEPTVLPPAWPGAPERVRSLLAVDRVAARRPESGATGQVLVLGPSSWAAVPSGARVAAAGRLRPGGAREPDGRGPAERAARRTWCRPPAGPDVAASRFRDGVRSLAATLPGDAGALLAGVTVGDTAAVPDDLAAALRTAGLTHVTAVSGAHFSLVAALVLALAAALRLPRRGPGGAHGRGDGGDGARRAPVAERAAGRGDGSRSRCSGSCSAARTAPPPRSRRPSSCCSSRTRGWPASSASCSRCWPPAAWCCSADRSPTAGRGRCGRPVATALALPVAAQLVCAPVDPAADARRSRSTPSRRTCWPRRRSRPRPCSAWRPAASRRGGPPARRCSRSGAGAACWWIGAVARVAAAAPGAQVAWLPGWAGRRPLLAAAGACAPPAARRSRAAPSGGASVTSGRLCPCPPPPAAPPSRATTRHGRRLVGGGRARARPAGQRRRGPARRPRGRPRRRARARRRRRCRGHPARRRRLHGRAPSAWSPARPCSPRTRSSSSTGSSARATSCSSDVTGVPRRAPGRRRARPAARRRPARQEAARRAARRRASPRWRAT